MTAFAVLMAVAAVAALADWIAVATGRRRLEYLAKPAVLAALTAAAAVIPVGHLDVVSRRSWFVAALGCCLVGDVLLMLPNDAFVPGLAAFLAGHLLFVGGFLQPPPPVGGVPFSFSAVGLAVSAFAVVAVAAAPATLVVRAVWRGDNRTLVGPVAVYMAAIATMVVLACNIGNPYAAIGAWLFLVSDSVLALDRFVVPLARGDLTVHVTYHLAQGLLVLSLLN